MQFRIVGGIHEYSNSRKHKVVDYKYEFATLNGVKTKSD